MVEGLRNDVAKRECRCIAYCHLRQSNRAKSEDSPQKNCPYVIGQQANEAKANVPGKQFCEHHR